MSDRQEVAKTKECKDCGSDFDLTVGELEWYKEKFGENYAEPERCKKCRNARKAAKLRGADNE